MGGYGGCTGGYAMSYGGGYGGGYVSMPYTGVEGYATYSGAGPYAYPSYYGDLPYGAPTTSMGVGTDQYNRNADTNERGNRDNSRDESRAQAPATIVVSLPADARLTVDGEATSATSTERTFISPPLEPNKTYHYTLQAQVNRNGKTQTTSKEIAVRAGEETRVALDFSKSVAQR
jgi:uncharacterized protein (TIGR03000 family)